MKNLFIAIRLKSMENIYGPSQSYDGTLIYPCYSVNREGWYWYPLFGRQCSCISKMHPLIHKAKHFAWQYKWEDILAHYNFSLELESMDHKALSLKKWRLWSSKQNQRHKSFKVNIEYELYISEDMVCIHESQRTGCSSHFGPLRESLKLP